MERIHTPGPWTEVQPIASCHGAFAIKEVHEDIKAIYESGQPWQEHQEANARLIAAAPELLEALQEVAATEMFLPDHPRRQAAYKAARAAIAKATQP